MRTFMQNIIHLLDGTPAVYGKRQSGQSLVEMALITPILIIMLMGMVEIGWFANNYLTLLDVARAGARRASVLQEQLSPLQWSNVASYAPAISVTGNDYTEQGLPLTNSSALTMPGTYPPDPNQLSLLQTNTDSVRGNQRNCSLTTASAGTTPPGFYWDIACIVQASLAPQIIDRDNDIDDIVISAFSLARITTPQTVDPTGDRTALQTNIAVLGAGVRPGGAGASTHVVVTGRYPTNANECDVRVVEPIATPPTFQVVPLGDSRRADANSPFEYRDPFDFNQNDRRDARAIDNGGAALGNGLFTEAAGYDPVITTIDYAEKAVGFSLTGQHWIRGTGCLGSNFTVRRVEQLVNLPSFNMTDEQRRAQLPHQGIVLVEIFWEHSMLLQFPVFNPVVAAFSGDITPTVTVWAIFPLPQIEPTNATLGLPFN